MRAAAWLALVVVVAACSQPEQRRKRPDKIFVGRLGSGDNPTELVVAHSLGDARATAPGPGTWWYVVRVKPWIDMATQLTVSARHVTSATKPSPGRVRVDVFDGEREIAGIATTPVESEVVLDERPEPIEPLLVRVTTTGKARIYVTVMRDSRAIPQPERPPPCDRHNMDPSNPNCAGMSPHCDLNNPDFNNPDCCMADCEFGALRCQGKVLSGSETGARIAIGKSLHIMRLATGHLYQRGDRVSEVLVLEVMDHESVVMIVSPERVNFANIVRDGYVVLAPPRACKRR